MESCGLFLCFFYCLSGFIVVFFSVYGFKKNWFYVGFVFFYGKFSENSVEFYYLNCFEEVLRFDVFVGM